MSTDNQRPGPDVAHVREAMREHDRENPPVPRHREESSRREPAEEKEDLDDGNSAVVTNAPDRPAGSY